MNARAYLEQAHYIDRRIDSKIEQVASLRELATRATSILSDTPRSPSPDMQPIETILAKIFELEAEINADIDTLVDLKREMVAVIKEVNNPEYQTLLELRYLCFKSWEQIAVYMGYSLQHVFRLRERALQIVAVPFDKAYL